MIPQELNFEYLGTLLSLMMHRYDLDIARTCHRQDRDTDFIYKKWSIGYDTTQYITYFEVYVHHSLSHPRIWHLEFRGMNSYVSMGQIIDQNAHTITVNQSLTNNDAIN